MRSSSLIEIDHVYGPNKVFFNFFIRLQFKVLANLVSTQQMSWARSWHEASYLCV